MEYCKPFNRRIFLKSGLLLSAGVLALPKAGVAADKKKQVITVTGTIDASAMGQTLAHEHILVDFIGAEEINPPAMGQG